MFRRRRRRRRRRQSKAQKAVFVTMKLYVGIKLFFGLSDIEIFILVSNWSQGVHP
jgi:hypothetical protein